MNRYWPYVEKLLKENKAYYCYCTPEELEKERKKMRKEGKVPHYSGKCRNLSEKEIEKFEKDGRKPAVRLKIPRKIVSFKDPARGKISVDSSEFGDIIIARSDKTALLILASTIDDIEMKITHTIRGEDYLNFVPRQILIYEALDYEPPVFAHLPFVYAQDGTKLSKRHGATAVSDFRKLGYLPDAIFNYLALLGWSPKDDREILNKREIIKLFKLKDVNTNAYKFDIDKLDHINSVYIKKAEEEKLIQLIKECLKNPKFNVLSSKLSKILPLLRERISKLSEVPALVEFFVKDIKYNPKVLLDDGADKDDLKSQLSAVKGQLSKLDDWNSDEIYKIVKKVFKSGEYNKKYFWKNLYLAIEGKETGLPLFESMEILGKEKSLQRLKDAINSF